MDITQFRFDPDLARILNANFAQRHKIVPVASDGQTITIAMSFPLQRNELRQIENFIKFRIKPVIAKERDISAAMQQLFNLEKPPATSPAPVSIEISDYASRDTSGAKTTGEAVSASIDPLVKNLIFHGISKRPEIFISNLRKKTCPSDTGLTVCSRNLTWVRTKR